MNVLDEQKRSSSRPSWKQPWLILFVVAAATIMALLSLQRYWGHNTRAFDLGTMSQAIWSVTQGEPLIFTTEGMAISRLARHVEFIYFALVPAYALFPSPATLLVLQAVIYALGAVPVYRLARRYLSVESAAVALAAVYLLYPVAMTAVLFEFHADTLAMPLLLFMIEALDRRSWGAYAFWLVLSLACKYYVAVPVAVLGGVLWLRGDRRVGAYTFLAGVTWGVIAFMVIRPLFAPQDAAAAVALRATVGSYVDYYFGQLDLLLPRAATAMIVLLPSLILLGWRAPLWLLPALAVSIPVLLSTGPGPSFDYRFHHYAIAVPFLVAAAVFGAAKVREKRMEQEAEGKLWSQMWYRFVIYTLILTAVLSVIMVDTPLNPLFYRAVPGSGRGVDETGYATTSRDVLRRSWAAATVPEDAAVMADRLSGLHLVNRPVLYRTKGLEGRTVSEALADVDYVVTDALHDFALGGDGAIYEGGVDYEWQTVRTLLAEPAFGLVRARDGLLIFERGAEGGAFGLELGGDGEPAGRGEAIHLFGDALALLGAEIREDGDGHFEAQFEWSALPALSQKPALLAISRLEGVDDARIVHLPTLALLPTTEWPTDGVVRESISFDLPEGLAEGEYEVWVGWYDSSSVVAAATDERSRVGEEFLVGTVRVR